MRLIVAICFLFSLIEANEYEFDMDAIETKTYEYSGYIKASQKHQKTKQNKTINSYLGEAIVGFDYFVEQWTLKSQFQANYYNTDKEEKSTDTINQLYIDYKLSSNNRFDIGKQSLMWGKAYFFNPVAFLDRKKDPNNPEASKEGYVIAHYKYNKSYERDLQNFSLDIVYMPTSKDTNDDFLDENSNTIALKAYFLYLDTDIDIIYFHNDKLDDKFGFDFSKNILTNFEIHGEYAKLDDENSSSVVGIKYLTSYDLTITSEYFDRSYRLKKPEPFYDKRYFINKFSLKEPFGMVYSSVYYKNSLNLLDNSTQNSLGTVYNFKNNIQLDLSYIKNIGEKKSEFGSKNIEDTILSKLIWYF